MRRDGFDKLEFDNSKKPEHGLDVTMESEKMEKDEWARNLLRDIGKTVSQKEVSTGMEYVGSIAMHLMIEKQDIKKDTYRVSSITQMATDGNVSESVMALAFNNAQIAIRKNFNERLKLGRRNDKR